MPPPTWRPTTTNPGGDSFASNFIGAAGGILDLYGQYEYIRGGRNGGSAPTPATADNANVRNSVSQALYDLIPKDMRESMVRTAREDAINITLADAGNAAKNNIVYLIGGGIVIAGLTYLWIKK